jgi:hypothetical protein
MEAIKLISVTMWLLLLVPGLTACGGNFQWILVEKTLVQAGSDESENRPHVTSTERFRVMRAEQKVVAYRPPDKCMRQSVGKTTGETETNRDYLQTVCGAWLAELESAFVERGYQVVSWQSLVGNMENQVDGAAVIETARRQGVKVLLIINSLEAGEVSDDTSQSSRLSFYQSDENGGRGKKLPLGEETIDSLKRLLPQEKHESSQQVSVTLHVTAVELETNQAVWFFRQTISTTTAPGSESYKRLFYCYGRQMCFLQDSDLQTGSHEKSTSEITLSRSGIGRNANSEQKQRYRLIRNVVASLANEYAQGK